MKVSRGKQLCTWLLVLTMLAAMCVFGAGSAFATELPTITMELSDADKQLSFIQTQVASLKQNDGENTWYYTVSDFDHDGSLEFVAATFHPLDRSTNLKIWEVNADGNGLTECSLNKDEDESFPDIMTDSADTYHNPATDIWSYMYYDNVVISDTEVYTIKTAVSMRDNKMGYTAYAVEHTVLSNGQRSVTHTDMNGVSISSEQYNASGTNAFAGQERTSTNFEWLKGDEVDNLTRLTDSFSVFMGVKMAPQTFPVPKPAALQGQEPAATAAPAATAPPVPTPAPQPAQTMYLTITKNPTNETRKQGDTAYFVACANIFDSLTWTFVSPNGGEYTTQSFGAMYANASVGGQASTTLSIGNVTPDMTGWGAYCTFYYQGQTARTSTAYLTVHQNQQPSAPSGTYSGVVTDWNYSSVSILVANTVNVTLPWGTCDVVGDLYSGAPATVYWDGANVTYCYIQGATSVEPTPAYGSISGTAYEGGGGYAIYLANGKQVYVDGWKCTTYGRFYEGASCMVYYTDYPTSDSIYSVDIYGSDEPLYNQNNFDLPYTTYDERIQNIIDNSWDIPDSVYEDIFGEMILEEMFGGGWAGSNYYADEGLW